MKKMFVKSLFMLCLWSFCAAAEQILWKFDAGDDKQAPEAGWIRLGRRTAYNDKAGYGWVREWGIPWLYDKDSGPARDGLNASRTGIDGVFKCKVPNGIYRVTVTLGMRKPSEGRTGQCVEINGRIVLAPPGVGGWGVQVKRTLPAVVTDGMMKIRFFTTASRSSDRTCVGAIEIEKISGPQSSQVKQAFEASPPAGDESAGPVKVKAGKHTLQVFHRVINKPLPPDAGKAPFFFIRDFSGDMLDDTVPRSGEYPAVITGFSAAGEINGFFAALHAPRKVTVRKIVLSDLNSGKGVISSSNAELFTLTSLYRSEYDRNRFVGRKTAELLEYDLPAELAAGKTLPCYFTVSVPADTPAGTYKGTFSAETSEGVISAPVTLTVSAIKLKPHDRDFILSADADRWRGMTDGEIGRELSDMARHGVNGLTLRMAPGGGILHEDAQGNVINADFDRLEPMLRRAAALGLNRKILLSGTNMTLWGLNSLKVSTKGSWKQSNGILTVSHGREKKNSEIRSTYWCAAFPQKRYILKVTYRMPAGSANAQIKLFDSNRKIVAGPLRFNIPRADAFTTVTFEFETRFPTAQFMFHLYFSGKENLELKTLSMKAADFPAGELLSHSNFRRITPPFDANAPWPPVLADQYRRIISANASAVRRLGFEPLIFGTDEAGNNPKSAGREIQELAEARKAGGVTFCNCSPAMAEKALPHLDVICCYSSFIPDDPERTLLKRYHRMGKKLFAVSAGTYAGQNFSIMPNRYNSGFYVAKTGVDGLWIWTYQRVRNDPFDDFDDTGKKYALVYPPRKAGGEPVRSIAWEGVREGIRDYTWFRNLEYAIEQARKEKRTADAERGKTVLNCILQAIPEEGSFSASSFNDKAADRLRRLCAVGIEAANGRSELLGKAELNRKPVFSQKMLPAQKTAEKPLLIPGANKENRWKNALVIDRLFNYVTAEPWNNGKYQTVFKITSDKDNLYLLAELKYPADSKSAPGKGEAAGFSGDHIEFLIEPVRGSGRWYQFAVNRSGQKSEMYCTGSRSAKENIFVVNYGEHARDISWSCKWDARVTDTPGAWHAELTIPLESINAVSGNFWGVLTARCGIGNNIVNKAFGFFDQPEKFPSMIAAGEAGLRTVPEIPNVIGINAMNLRFNNLHEGKFVLREFTDGKVSAFKADIRKDGTAGLHYRLTPKTGKIELEAMDRSGSSVWKNTSSIRMADALTVSAAERVFFDDSGKLSVKVRCSISPKLAKNANLEIVLQNTAGKVLFSQKFPARNAEFSCGLEAFENGFYRMVFNIKEGKRTYAVKTVDFAVLKAK